MKVKVEYSESVQVSEGLWRKIGIELEDDDTPIHPDALHQTAKDYVKRWHSVQATNPNWDHHERNPITQREQYIVSDKPKVINREAERVQVLIENSTTMEELMQYRDKAEFYQITAFTDKYNELSSPIN